MESEEIKNLFQKFKDFYGVDNIRIRERASAFDWRGELQRFEILINNQDYLTVELDKDENIDILGIEDIEINKNNIHLYNKYIDEEWFKDVVLDSLPVGISINNNKDSLGVEKIDKGVFEIYFRSGRKIDSDDITAWAEYFTKTLKLPTYAYSEDRDYDFYVVFGKEPEKILENNYKIDETKKVLIDEVLKEDYKFTYPEKTFNSDKSEIKLFTIEVYDLKKENLGSYFIMDYDENSAIEIAKSKKTIHGDREARYKAFEFKNKYPFSFTKIEKQGKKDKTNYSVEINLGMTEKGYRGGSISEKALDRLITEYEKTGKKFFDYVDNRIDLFGEEVQIKGNKEFLINEVAPLLDKLGYQKENHYSWDIGGFDKIVIKKGSYVSSSDSPYSHLFKVKEISIDDVKEKLNTIKEDENPFTKTSLDEAKKLIAEQNNTSIQKLHL